MSRGKTSVAASGVGPVQTLDLALVRGDRQLFSEFLEPHLAGLQGQPARIVRRLADDLAAYYVADTLAYLTRMLPPPRKGGLFRRSPRPPAGEDCMAPDPSLLQSAPRQALSAWVERHRGNGGMLLHEARAIFKHVSVAQVLRARRLPIAADTLGGVHFPEELPNEAYLETLVTAHAPRGFYWTDRQLADLHDSLRLAFTEWWIGFCRRFMRIASPQDLAQVDRAYAGAGAQIADAMVRMRMPIGVYRKRRLEALAIFGELIAPSQFAKPTD